MHTGSQRAGSALGGRQYWHEAMREISEELVTGRTGLAVARAGVNALTWLRQLDVIDYSQKADTDYFVIAVPNKFALDYVDSYLRASIERSLCRLTHHAVALEFQVRKGEPEPEEEPKIAPKRPSQPPRKPAQQVASAEPPQAREAQVDISSVGSDNGITVEELDWDPTRLGWTMTSNYFKHFWMGLIGHEAAALYELIKSFCYGSKDDARPSVARLAASMRVDRHKLTGRKRKKPNGEEYREEGLFDVLRRHRLLWVIVRGSGRESEYVFKIVKNPPLLLPSQVAELRPPLQELHRRLLAKSDDAFRAYVALAQHNGEDVPVPMEIERELFSAAAER